MHLLVLWKVGGIIHCWTEGVSAILHSKINVESGNSNMSRMTIHGSEYPIRKIFSDDFFFTIPRYQRPLHYICRYILLRLDASRLEGGASYDYQAASVEHVLPQRPAPDSRWHQLFPSKEARDKYVNRLGNLVLLSRGRNMNAENYDFELKKEKYFFAGNTSTPFARLCTILAIGAQM
jgi:hypothetical protein